MMWPKEKTAFVVIHGIGGHEPFQTLDTFVRGFWEVLKKHNDPLKIRWQHRLLRHQEWIENYVSLTAEGKPALDFYEYYWDCYMVHKIVIDDVLDWLNRASAGAKSFYKKMEEVAKRHDQAGIDLFRDGEFSIGAYLIVLGWLGRILRLFSLMHVPKAAWIVKPMLKFVSKFIVGLLGDIVIYTWTDARSKNYETRQKVLGGAVEQLKLLLKNSDYQRIIVVGHSLGSIIAYDALNRIAHEMSVGGGTLHSESHKLVGLVTLGSPLDKIAFFFRERARDEQFVRRQILFHFHGLKRIGLPGDEEPVPIGNPVGPHLNEMQWLNFYHLRDLVSGHLDAYEVDRNIPCEVRVTSSLEAHTCYWEHMQMYEDIAAEFF